MILRYPYICYNDVLDHETCQKIISHGMDKVSEATTQGDDTVRRSNTAFLSDRWLYDLVSPYIHQANTETGWNYEFDEYEPLQFTVYEQDGRYDWHSDGGGDIHAADDTGRIRKISMTLNLTDPSTYTGGDLEFDLPRDYSISGTHRPDARRQGTMVVFPSYMRHQVTPVSSGTRYSLVLWALGRPFR